MTEEQQDEPDKPSTQLDLTPHDDRPYIVNDINEVLKELINLIKWQDGGNREAITRARKDVQAFVQK